VQTSSKRPEEQSSYFNASTMPLINAVAEADSIKDEEGSIIGNTKVI